MNTRAIGHEEPPDRGRQAGEVHVELAPHDRGERAEPFALHLLDQAAEVRALARGALHVERPRRGRWRPPSTTPTTEQVPEPQLANPGAARPRSPKAGHQRQHPADVCAPERRAVDDEHDCRAPPTPTMRADVLPERVAPSRCATSPAEEQRRGRQRGVARVAVADEAAGDLGREAERAVELQRAAESHRRPTSTATIRPSPISIASIDRPARQDARERGEPDRDEEEERPVGREAEVVQRARAGPGRPQGRTRARPTTARDRPDRSTRRATPVIEQRGDRDQPALQPDEHRRDGSTISARKRGRGVDVHEECPPACRRCRCVLATSIGRPRIESGRLEPEDVRAPRGRCP